MKRILPAAALVLSTAAAPWQSAQAQAQGFDATCVDSTECRVTVDGEQLVTSRGLKINAEDILYWSASDNTKKANLGWCFLVGANCYAREDYRFMIKYMDGEGRRQITQIGFFNHKPARAFASILTVFSGLESGQVAGMATSKNRDAAMNPDSVEPYTDVTLSAEAKPKGAAQVGDANGSTPAVRHSKPAKVPVQSCWSKYLDANPNMKVWVDANPELSKPVKARYDDC